MLAPIPTYLLGESMLVKVPADGEYGGVYEDAVTVASVRYQDAAELKRMGYVLSDGSEGIIYMDAVNSKGAFNIPVGSLITIGTDERQVVKCTPCKDFGAHIHHWEVEVK